MAAWKTDTVDDGRSQGSGSKGRLVCRETDDPSSNFKTGYFRRTLWQEQLGSPPGIAAAIRSTVTKLMHDLAAGLVVVEFVTGTPGARKYLRTVLLL